MVIMPVANPPMGTWQVGRWSCLPPHASIGVGQWALCGDSGSRSLALALCVQ
jgi:hypothetical protein